MPTSEENLRIILEIITRFYEDAWLSLVTVLATIIAASVTIVGIIIPLIISYLQRKQQSKEFNNLIVEKNKELEIDIQNLKESFALEKENLEKYFKEMFASLIEEKFQLIKEEHKKDHNTIVACMSHSQGLFDLSRNKDLEAGLAFILAAKYFHKGNSEYNLSNSVTCLIKMNKLIEKENFDTKSGKKFLADLIELISQLKANQPDGLINKLGDDLDSAYYFTSKYSR